MYSTIHSTLFAPDCAICFVFVVSFPNPILTAKFWTPLYILTLTSSVSSFYWCILLLALQVSISSVFISRHLLSRICTLLRALSILLFTLKWYSFTFVPFNINISSPAYPDADDEIECWVIVDSDNAKDVTGSQKILDDLYAMTDTSNFLVAEAQLALDLASVYVMIQIPTDFS